jgi:heptosyltransferase II
LRARTRRPVKYSILLAVDAQHWKKIWPLEHWQELLRLLHHWEIPELQLTLVGRDSPIADPETWKIKAKPNVKVDYRVGKTVLSQLVDLAASHHLCISGNTAWQHLAEAVGTPVVSFLGPLHRSFGFSPFLGASDELSVDLPCRPCTLHGGGKCVRVGSEFHACMKDITPSIVFKTIQSYFINYSKDLERNL